MKKNLSSFLSVAVVVAVVVIVVVFSGFVTLVYTFETEKGYIFYLKKCYFYLKRCYFYLDLFYVGYKKER
jgi:hypothetical protein